MADRARDPRRPFLNSVFRALRLQDIASCDAFGAVRHTLRLEIEWVDWFNNRRLLEPIGDIPPVEFEAMYYEGQEGPARKAGLN